MNYQDPTKPDTSVFLLALVLIIAIASGFTGDESLYPLVGCVVIGSGGWATWKIGRWLFLRNAQPRNEVAFR